MADQQGPNITPSQATTGLNLNLNTRSAKAGTLTYALNAVVEGVNGEGISYQDELGNTLCTNFPGGYVVVGRKLIPEQNLLLLWMVNPTTGDSQIGKIQDCKFSTVLSDACLGFSTDDPIHKAFYRIIHCGTEVYWRDRNGRRYINLDKLPFKEVPSPDGCGTVATTEVDCNKLLVQPNFTIPSIQTKEVAEDGSLTAGTYQFAVSYANEDGESYTSYYSITNPLPIFDESKVTLNFDYSTNKAIHLSIRNIDTSSIYDYVSLAVIKTINNITSFEQVGTYRIDQDHVEVLYTGQKTAVLTEGEIFEKFPVFKGADDVYSVQGVLGWVGMTQQERVSYQEIASKIQVQWQTWRLHRDSYKDPVKAEKFRGYMRDEVYPLELVPLLKSGKQCDGFTIPGRTATPYDLEIISGQDVVTDIDKVCDKPEEGKPRWQVYNTATTEGYDPGYDPNNSCYEGPVMYGKMGYWESTEEYDCTSGLTGKIRHHRMPDEVQCARYEQGGEYIYALGLRINVGQVWDAIMHSSLTQEQKDDIQGFKIVRGNRASGQKSVVAKGMITNVGKYNRDSTWNYYPAYGPGNYHGRDPFLGFQSTHNDDDETTDKRLDGFNTDDSLKRFTLHSPDTSFYQPSLGSILKLEAAEWGKSEGHFQNVKGHSRYSFRTYAVNSVIARVVFGVGVISALDGVSTGLFDGASAFAAMQTLTDTVDKILPKVNYAYQFNSVGHFTHSMAVPNNGEKQRFIDLASYLQPGMRSIGDDHTINNHQRESAVYLRTTDTLPFPESVNGVTDNSLYTLGDIGDCSEPGKIHERDISAYYASLKRNLPNQWGQLYSYETIDTGFQWIGQVKGDNFQAVFGGDTFINRFAYKSKLPLFLDHRVGAPDGADIFYNELNNVGYSLYWLSTDNVNEFTEIANGGAKAILKAMLNGPMGTFLLQMMSRKQNNFDCTKPNKFFWQNGKFYLFAYGIPYFFCESEVNVDLRQAFNGKEGDFYPHVGSGIPDEWLQEVNTTIQQDNTYHYNKSYSKQNKENYFLHIPTNWDPKCETYDPYLTVYSDPNKWLVYRSISRFQFPSNWGHLTSVDGILNQAVLARFENKSVLYNALLTIQTSNPQAAYLGNDTLFKSSPPIEFSEADSGFAGSQHKLLIRTPEGAVYVDSLRGDVFLLQGTQPRSLATPEVGTFLGEHLFVDGDNHFQGKGITGVYDPMNKRILLTKLDGKESFTLSYNFLTQSWVSLHSYLPRFYVEHPTTFYASNNTGLWIHGTDPMNYHNFFGEEHPYVIEYPVQYQYQDELLQGVSDYSKVMQYFPDGTFIYTDDWFNQAILWNDQQCSGIRNLFPRPKSSLKARMEYPRYNGDSIDILYTKSNSMYNFNTLWNVLIPGQPIWKPSAQNLSILKDLNQSAMRYGKNTYGKAPLLAKDLRIRLIHTDTNRRIISQFLTSESIKK